MEIEREVHSDPRDLDAALAASEARHTAALAAIEARLDARHDAAQAASAASLTAMAAVTGDIMAVMRAASWRS